MNVHPREEMSKKMKTHTFTWSEMEHTAVHNGGSEAFVSRLDFKTLKTEIMLFCCKKNQSKVKNSSNNIFKSEV